MVWKHILIPHIVATIYCAWVASDDGLVFDTGFYVVPHVHSVAPWMINALTACIPMLCVWNARDTARLVRRAVSMFSALWIARTLCICATILPVLLHEPLSVFSLLLGGRGDYIFSGHTAAVASWIWYAEMHPRWKCMMGGVHATCLLAARMHYTIDILLVWILAYAWTSSSAAASGSSSSTSSIRLGLIKPSEYDQLATIRELIYARELHQYPGKTPELARIVIGAYDEDDVILGYIAITPPGDEKKTPRCILEAWDEAYECRALCVLPEYRRRHIGRSLVHAALRYVETAGGTTIVASARRDLVPIYARYGFQAVWDAAYTTGAVSYIPGYLVDIPTYTRAIEPAPAMPHQTWTLPYPARLPHACLHGNGSIDSMTPHHGVHADVLDAWYDPAPSVLATLSNTTQQTAWKVKTSPPCQATLLARDIAAHRKVQEQNIVCGAGSSDLMYRCFPMWLTSSSRVLLCTPTYAEYPHILHHVIGCQHVDECPESEFASRVQTHGSLYDCIICVNPNSPSGRYQPHLASVVSHLPPTTLVWIDETYIDYISPDASLERFAATSPNVVVCKSMSKIYALSGMRVAYLCGSPLRMDAVRMRTPPWVIGRMTYDAARAALDAWSSYYAHRIAETHQLREALRDAIRSIEGCVVDDGATANFIVCRVPPGCARRVCEYAKLHHAVYLKACTDDTLRVTVRNAQDNSKVVEALRNGVMCCC